MRKSDEYPTTEDVTGAIRALARLQDTYQYNAHQLTTGELLQGYTCVECLTGRLLHCDNCSYCYYLFYKETDEQLNTTMISTSTSQIFVLQFSWFYM